MISQSEYERDLITQIERQLDVLKYYMKSPDENLQRIFDELNGKIIDPEIAERYKNQIDSEYNKLIDSYDTFTRASISETYIYANSYTMSVLKGIDYKTLVRTDTKALNILFKNMQTDFAVTAKDGNEFYRSYVEFSKQGMLTESQIDAAVAKGFLKKENLKGAKDLLRSELQKEVNKELYDRVNKDSRFFKKIKFDKIDGMSVNDAMKIRLKKEFEEKLKDDKFMFLINKNGDVMTFKIDTYANLVAKTRLGEAQTVGSIEAGISMGFKYFQVTSHNTTTKVCQQFEGKILTTDRNDKRFPFLSKKTSPLYHINCEHRLYPTLTYASGKEID